MPRKAHRPPASTLSMAGVFAAGVERLAIDGGRALRPGHRHAAIEAIHLGDIEVAVTRKKVKNVHLSVHPPDGRVTLVAPTSTRTEAARAYAVSKLGWIRAQQAKLREQARETPRTFVTRESHNLWGKRYLLSVVEEEEAKPRVTRDHRRITLHVRPGSSIDKRRAVIHEWHKALLHDAVPPLIETWEPTLGVTVEGYFLQRKTKWGGQCPDENHPVEYGTGEEAKGSAGRCCRSRNATPHRAHAQSAIRRLAGSVLPWVARSPGGTERTSSCCRGVVEAGVTHPFACFHIVDCGRGRWQRNPQLLELTPPADVEKLSLAAQQILLVRRLQGRDSGWVEEVFAGRGSD